MKVKRQTVELEKFSDLVDDSKKNELCEFLNVSSDISERLRDIISRPLSEFGREYLKTAQLNFRRAIEIQGAPNKDLASNWKATLLPIQNSLKEVVTTLPGPINKGKSEPYHDIWVRIQADQEQILNNLIEDCKPLLQSSQSLLQHYEDEIWLAPSNNPDVLVASAFITEEKETSEGVIVAVNYFPVLQLINALEKDPELIHEFCKHTRHFEEFLAATYDAGGAMKVTITPERKDGGRDVIATFKIEGLITGLGCITVIDQAKTKKKGSISVATVREMMGVLRNTQRNNPFTKAYITTNANFSKDACSEFKVDIDQGSLVLRNGLELRKWLIDWRDGKIKIF